MPAHSFEVAIAHAVSDVIKAFYGVNAVQDVWLNTANDSCVVSLNVLKDLGIREISVNIKAPTAQESFAELMDVSAPSPVLTETEGYSDEPIFTAVGAGRELPLVDDAQL